MTVAEVRRLRRLTQTKLAEMLGISRIYLAQIEQGRRVISLWRLSQLANALDVSESRLCRPPKSTVRAPAGRPGPKQKPYAASKWIGVAWRNGLAYGAVQHEGETHTTKGFSDDEDAARARDRLAKRLHGKRARLNFPD